MFGTTLLSVHGQTIALSICRMLHLWLPKNNEPDYQSYAMMHSPKPENTQMTQFHVLHKSFIQKINDLGAINPVFHTVIPVMNYVEDLMKNDFRKDGDPAFIHQLHGCLYILLMGMDDLNTIRLLKLYMLHDADEDYDIGIEKIEELLGSDDPYLIRAIDLMNKNKHGFEKLSSNYLSAIGKGVDRTVNVRTMGVFTLDKKRKYVTETVNEILPMMKTARKQFKNHERVLQLLREGLKMQLAVYQQIVN